MPSFWENLRFPGEREMDDLHGAQGLDMASYVSHPSPSEGSSFPAVIVIMEAFGVTSHIEKVCDQYAANGYVAIAPALYHRQHPNPKLGYDEMPAVQGYMGALQDNEIIEDVNVAIDYLQNKYKRSFQIRTCDGANRPPRRTRGLPLGTEAAQRSHKRMPMRGSSPCGRETGSRWLRSNWRSESLEVQRDNAAQATVRSSCCRVNAMRDSDFGDKVALAVRELPWRARIP
jgi:hypothetical protein